MRAVKKPNLDHRSAAPPLHVSRDALEGQVAMRLAGHLSRGANALPHDISERLRFGRERALGLARQQQRAVAPAAAATAWQSQGRSATLLGGPPALWLRMASALPLVVLLFGLVMIQKHHQTEQILVAAEIDSALLADELPPDAYGDPGFSEYLRRSTAP